MVLKVKNVQYSYKSQKERETLKNVSIQFEDYKMYGLAEQKNPRIYWRK